MEKERINKQQIQNKMFSIVSYCEKSHQAITQAGAPD